MTGKHTQMIRDVLKTPDRFLRSTNLERDFEDPRALESYTMTPFIANAFRQIVAGAASGSGRRAWRITGDYGVGKSSFALFVSQYLAHQRSRWMTSLLKEVGGERLPRTKPMIPVLVTGDREGLVRAIARAIGSAFSCRTGRRSKACAALIDLASKVAKSGSNNDFGSLLDATSDLADSEGAGMLVVLDEMGKFLEHAAGQPDKEDIFILQQLAERAARSGAKPFLFVGLLHQGFHAYAERLPHAQRHEWDKVAGRFEEIVFDQPLAHTSLLAARALGVDATALSRAVAAESRELSTATVAAGWPSRSRSGEAASLYPLHPMVLPVLVRFFGRFGQNERSLFGFLLSNEPSGVLSFAERPSQTGAWYRLSDFFDYVRATFGHRLAGESYRSSWLRLIELVDRLHEVGPLELDVVKTVAVLNLLDADDLVATEDAIAAALLPWRDADIGRVLRDLVKRGVLFKRGQIGGYRLWSASSVNLDAALSDAARAIGDTGALAEQLVPHLDMRPIAARAHYLKFGTLRYFDVNYAPVASLHSALEESFEADGRVVVALPENEAERKLAVAAGRGLQRDGVILIVPETLAGLAAELREIKLWRFVIGNTPELADDPFALAEAERQSKRCSENLASKLETLVGLRSSLRDSTAVYHTGSIVKFARDRRLATFVSSVCDDVYTDSPKIMNELLNRNSLGSAAAAARMKLIEGLYNSPGAPLLGIDETKSPPEKSMYLSVLLKGNVHRRSGERLFVEEPPADDDPLRLRPSLSRLVERLEEAKGARVTAEDLMAELRRPPYGVRDGVAPLLLAIVLSTRSHEIALYENGTFIPKFGSADFLRLSKQPSSFECQLCRIVGVRADVFRRLLEVYSSPSSGRSSALLDVVTPLCRFVAELQEYTRRSADLSPAAIAVREALLKSTDPSALLFSELPRACGIEPFEYGTDRDQSRIEEFVSRLRSATEELHDAYTKLMAKIKADVAKNLGAGDVSFDRAHLAGRAARVALAAREPRLRSFSNKLRDLGIAEEPWMEALAAVVMNKPPARWTGSDLANWTNEIAVLGETFLRVEATAFGTGPEPRRTAVRIGLTRADGREIARVIETRPELEEDVARAVTEIDRVLSSSKADRLAVLYRMLWEDLGGADEDSEDDAEATRANI